MLTEKEAQDLMSKFHSLKNDKSKIKEFKKHESECIQKFSYMVKMKTAKYKCYSNYDDLNQEAYEALSKAMHTYDPTKKALFFWWAHKYLDTRISRSANLHSTIRYPMAVTKTITPQKQKLDFSKILIDKTPSTEFDVQETKKIVQDGLNLLPEKQKQIVSLVFGLDEDPMSINKICNLLKISRSACIKHYSKGIKTLANSIVL